MYRYVYIHACTYVYIYIYLMYNIQTLPPKISEAAFSATAMAPRHPDPEPTATTMMSSSLEMLLPSYHMMGI